MKFDKHRTQKINFTIYYNLSKRNPKRDMLKYSIN